MPKIKYSRYFEHKIIQCTNEISHFFNGIPNNNTSLKQYRNYKRYARDLRIFQQKLKDIERGQSSLAHLTIGSFLFGRRTYILAEGPWRGYFRKRKSGVIVGLIFIDLRP